MRELAQLQSDESLDSHYDVVVVGGGIHGVGVAQAAAAAGYSVALFEKSNLAHGTSSRSSKLIHGGLRYLETFDLSLVWESLRERQLLFQIAPTLVKPQKFFIPIYENSHRKALVIRIGLLLYSILAGGRKDTWFRTVPRSEWDSLDGLDTNRLKTVLQYLDGQTDDAALTRAVMHSARQLGAHYFCPAIFQAAKINPQDVHLEIQMGESQHSLRCQTVVNAAGPWANDVLERVTPKMDPLAVENIQGTHIEVEDSVTKGCYYLEAPDRRVVFVMPWKGRTLIGTTEIQFNGEPDLATPFDEEINYLTDLYAERFPDRNRTLLDSWSGLRVLPSSKGAAFKRSRETMLPVDNDQKPRLLSIYGGKLTGYRATATKVIRELSKTLPSKPPIADTRELTLIDPATQNGM